MGCRTTTTRRPAARNKPATRREVWLLPLPVRTAHTATTGTRAWSMVLWGPDRPKSAPAASAREARCITCSCARSL